MIGDFIKELRLKNDLTQDYLSKKLNISRPTYLQIEKGDRELTVAEAEKLAAIFNLSLDDFLSQKEVNIKVKIEPTQKLPSKDKEKNETIRISIPQQKVDKFKQILLYILKKVGGKPNIGMTALYKLLYFIDFDYYEKYEEQLMGLVYLKNHYGPTPLIFDNLIKDLTEKSQVEIVKNSKFYQYPQIKYLINPKVEPDLSILNGQEINHINEELQRLADLTANDLTALSHKDVPWITAQKGKPIDYEAVFYRSDETSVRDYDSGND